jgi:hypothetical protein
MPKDQNKPQPIEMAALSASSGSASLSMNEVQLGKRPADKKLEEVPMFKELVKPKPVASTFPSQITSKETFLQRYQAAMQQAQSIVPLNRVINPMPTTSLLLNSMQ